MNKILFVEDEPLIAKALSIMLNILGCEVDVAINGERAQYFYNNNSYDLILMDIWLPDTDGYKLTKKIRILEKAKKVKNRIPIIALSAHTTMNEKDACIAAGMNTLFTKPILKIQLEEMLATYLPKPKVNVPPIKGEIIDFSFAKSQLGYEDDVLKQILKTMLESIPEAIAAMNKALRDKNWHDLKMLAHKMHGGAAYCAAMRLKEASGRLEKALLKGKQESAPQLLKALIAEAKKFVLTLEAKKG